MRQRQRKKNKATKLTCQALKPDLHKSFPIKTGTNDSLTWPSSEHSEPIGDEDMAVVCTFGFTRTDYVCDLRFDWPSEKRAITFPPARPSLFLQVSETTDQ